MNKFSNENEYDRFFSHAIEILHSRGELDSVKEYVSAIEDQDYRDETRSKLGVFLTAQGRAEEGMQFVKAIKHPMERADALLGVAREHAKRGDRAKAKAALMEAISSVEVIERGTWETPSILLEVSAELHQADFRPDALSVLRRAVQLAQKGGNFDSAKVIGGAAVFVVGKIGLR